VSITSGRTGRGCSASNGVVAVTTRGCSTGMVAARGDGTTVTGDGGTRVTAAAAARDGDTNAGTRKGGTRAAAARDGDTDARGIGTDGAGGWGTKATLRGWDTLATTEGCGTAAAAAARGCGMGVAVARGGGTAATGDGGLRETADVAARNGGTRAAVATAARGGDKGAKGVGANAAECCSSTTTAARHCGTSAVAKGSGTAIGRGCSTAAALRGCDTLAAVTQSYTRVFVSSASRRPCALFDMGSAVYKLVKYRYNTYICLTCNLAGTLCFMLCSS
jgi:hypothetical protein